jgi:molybdenum storage protein
MSSVIHGSGTSRTDIDTPFREISFSSKLAESLASPTPVIRILPDVHVLKLGGQSMMDRGIEAVGPILEEIVAAHATTQMLLGVGGGTRARHIYSVALDLGMPTSVLAKLGVAVPSQNGRMLQMLMAKSGGILIDHDDFAKLPLYLRLGCIPIFAGMPPFEYWEKPQAKGRIPSNRTDAGVYLTAEALGAKSCIFIKDQDGLYTDNPKTSKNATFIPKISTTELRARNLADSIIEPVVVDYLDNAEHVRQVQIINGLKPGTLTRALAGEHVGTIIYAE